MVQSEILAYYRVEYANGIVQVKSCIPYSALTDIYGLYRLIDEAYVDSKLNRREKEVIVSAIKRELKGRFGEFWFLDRSPLYDAITSGELVLLPQQGGIHKVKIEQL